MPETKTIPLSGIAVAIHRLRALRPDKVDALAQSMTDQGLLQPIVVRPHKGGGYLLVAGLHRLEAAKKLKWQKQGDLLRLPWSAYDGTHIRLRQAKTGRRVVIPAGAPDTVTGTGPLPLKPDNKSEAC